MTLRQWIIRPGNIFPNVIGCFAIIYIFRIIKLIQNMIKRWFQNKFLSLLKISRATNTFLGGYFALKIEIYTFFGHKYANFPKKGIWQCLNSANLPNIVKVNHTVQTKDHMIEKSTHFHFWASKLKNEVASRANYSDCGCFPKWFFWKLLKLTQNVKPVSFKNKGRSWPKNFRAKIDVFLGVSSLTIFLKFAKSIFWTWNLISYRWKQSKYV